MEFAKFYCHDEFSDIPTSTGGVAMPTGSAYIVPGIYILGGQSWDCTRPGLYRFKVEGQPYFTQRICVGSPIDVYALLSGVSWNHIHGSADESADYQAMSNKGRFQRWRLRCGVIVGMMVWLLPQVGLSARSVNVVTTETPNGFDDGHIVLEVLLGGQWRMFDMTNGCYWRDTYGNHLSVAQFIAHIANNGPLPEKVMLDGHDHRWDAETTVVPGGVLDLGLYGELFIAPDEEAWLRRIFQAIV